MTELRSVLHVLGILLCGLAAVMLLPSGVDASVANPDWQAFLVSAGITGFMGGILVAGNAGGQAFELNLRQAFLLTAACWVLLPAFGALPFLGVGLDYSDAYFESVSGITTTGSTAIVGLDNEPPGILLWRALLQWVGGVGIIVMAMVVLPFLRIGGMQLFQIESSERSERVVSGTFRLASWITAIYVSLTLACAVLYGLTGMSTFDAVCHAMTTLSTGGYSTHDASFAYFSNPATQWVGVGFMLAGAAPFVAYIRMVRGRRLALWQDPQVRALIAFLCLTASAMAVWLSFTRDITLADAFRLTAFNITSVVTTTGFATSDYSTWGTAAAGCFLLFTFIGGCTGSTSGAIKIYRHQVIWVIMRAHLVQLVSPRRVYPLSYAGNPLPDDVPASVLAFFAAFMASVALFTIILSGMGLDLVTALSASATAIANVGPGLGPIVGPAGNFAALPDAAKWLLALAMLLGRLEIFALLVLLDPLFWRG